MAITIEDVFDNNRDGKSGAGLVGVYKEDEDPWEPMNKFLKSCAKKLNEKLDLLKTNNPEKYKRLVLGEWDKNETD